MAVVGVINLKQRMQYVKNLSEAIKDLESNLQNQNKVLTHSKSMNESSSVKLGRSGFESTAENLKVVKIFKFFSGHYGFTWNKGDSLDHLENLAMCWGMAMDGLSKEQISYGIGQISQALSHVDFPPNAGQFRRLCLAWQDPNRFYVTRLEHTPTRTEEVAEEQVRQMKEVLKEYLSKSAIISENIPTQNNTEQTIDDPQYSKTG